MLVAAAAAAALSVASPVQAQTSKPARIFIVWAPELTAQDLAAPSVSRALPDASVALASTRTAEVGELYAVALGAGERAQSHSGITLLGASLDRAGYSPLNVVREGAKPTATAQQLLGVPTPQYVARDLDDVAAIAPGAVAVIDTGGDVAALVAAVADIASSDDLVIVAGVVPSALRVRHGVRLGVVAFQGPGFSRGVLSSPTTRQSGLIALTDLAPTIAASLGVPIAEVEGRAATAHASEDPFAEVRTLERDLLEAHSARGPVTRTPLYAAMLLAVAVAFATRGVGPTRAPRALAAFGLFTLALPLAGFLGPSFPGLPLVWTILLAMAVAVAGFRAPFIAAAAIASATAIVPVVDLLLGSPLGHRSPWGILLSTGGRFYGASEDTLGFVAGGALVAAGLLARRALHVRIAVVILATLTLVMSAPGWGAKFGSAPTLVPAFAAFAVVALGHRLTFKVGLVIAFATVLVTSGVVFADRLRPVESRSHVARAIGGDTDVTALIARKWEANAAITFGRMWTPATLFGGAGIILLARRKRLHRGLMVAGPAFVVVTFTSLAANDGGVVTTALVAAIGLGAAAATARRSPGLDVEP